MTDVFVSYARSSELLANAAAEALRSRGYCVWIDDQIPAHRTYAEAIEEQLQLAKAVLVIWSEEAAGSQWVRAEADSARNAGKLVQMSADGTLPPIPFNQVQCADLRGWEGKADAPGWQKVEAGIAALASSEERQSEPRAAHVRKNSICVLPFQNMSGDAEQEYFSDGISEDITTDLSKISALAVTARNTAFTLKGAAVDVCEIARKLGVSHVLEGSVRKAGGRVRITAQLVDGATGDHLWAERYDRDLVGIFEIQDEISKAIVGALKLRLLPDEKRAMEQRETTSAEAYDFYLMARQYWITGNYGDIRRDERVIRLSRRAVEIDPEYARAWALMALAQLDMQVVFDKDADGMASAEEALRLDPNIAEAHCAKARFLASKGQLKEAAEEISVAYDLAPESWEVNKEAAWLSIAQRRTKDAIRHYEKAVSLIESDFHSWAMLVVCYQSLGDKEGVERGARMMISQSEAALAQDPSNGTAIGICAGGLAILGESGRAKDRIERALLIDPDNFKMRYNFACILACYLHETDAALDLLETALAKGNRRLLDVLEADTDFDSLRQHPRLQRMIADMKQRLGIVEPAPAIPPASAEPPRS